MGMGLVVYSGLLMGYTVLGSYHLVSGLGDKQTQQERRLGKDHTD